MVDLKFVVYHSVRCYKIEAVRSDQAPVLADSLAGRVA